MKTFLYDLHSQLGAQMGSYAGFEMPLYYSSVLKEHQQVRKKSGLFDISHMGRILIEGPDALSFLDYVATNRVKNLKEGGALYTPICHEHGGCVDDAIIYSHSSAKFSFVANAANRQKDLEHLIKYSKGFEVKITPLFEEGILALQGPLSKEVLQTLAPSIKSLSFMQGLELDFQNQSMFIARTGYTGELGYEIYGSDETLKKIWGFLLKETDGKVQPVGLAARDLLRLEMGYALYGHELSEQIHPTESVAKWAVKLDKEKFLGKESLLKRVHSDQKRDQFGIILLDRAIARQGYEVMINGTKSGVVTSGSISPMLEKPIAIIMVSQKLGLEDQISVVVRGKMVPAKLHSLPFYKKNEEK